MPEAAPLLPELILLAGLLFALAMVVVLRKLTEAVLNTLAGWLSVLPLVGSVTAGLITRFEQAISNALGSAISGIESAIGHSWHLFARVLDTLWAEQKLVAENLWHLAQSFYHFATLSDLQRWAHDLERLFHHTAGTVSRAVAKELHGVERRVGRLEHTLAHDAKRFAHAIDTTIPAEIGGLWGSTKALTDSLGRLWDRVRSIEGQISTAAIAAVVATVLASVGLDWLACKDGAARAGRSGCNLWSDLGSLLGLLGDVVLFANVCEFLSFASPFVSDVADVVIPALTDVGAGLCPGSIGPPPALPAVTLYTPPNPGVTLYTP